VEIRPEEPRDFEAIRTVNERAFPTTEEATLVEALRADGAHVPGLCLVACDEGDGGGGGGAVVGHIFYSRAVLQPAGVEVLALAPMAVLPEHQGTGVGSALVRESLRRAGATGHPVVVIVGHADYYPRFGAESAGALGIEAPFEVPAESWMAVRLPAWRDGARGTLEYHPAFG
jgi:predicted N-acetyltransferase YhbS